MQKKKFRLDWFFFDGRSPNETLIVANRIEKNVLYKVIDLEVRSGLNYLSNLIESRDSILFLSIDGYEDSYFLMSLSSLATMIAAMAVIVALVAD